MNERNNILLKLADRSLGPIILFIAGIFVSKNNNKKSESGVKPRIAVLKTGAFGDVILVGSAIKSIKNKWPNSQITFICTGSNVQAVKGIKGVDKTIVFELKKPMNSLLYLYKMGVFDYLFDFAPWARLNAVLSITIKAKRRYGFKTKGMYRHFVYSQTTEHSSNVHEIDNYRKLLEPAGIMGPLESPDFHIDYSRLSSIYEIAGKAIVFHPFPGGAKKTLKSWPEERWVELGKRIINDGYRVIISGGSDDAQAAEKIASAIGERTATSLAGKVDLNQMAEVIKKADALITVDTGIMHLGAAVGATVICLHGPTSPERWGGIGKRVLAITSTYACSPCISLGFESKCKDPLCMKGISVDKVYDYYLRLRSIIRKDHHYKV